MSSHSQQLAPIGGLPEEILEQVIEEILTAKTLAKFACTCSTINSIIQRKPLQFYLTDLRFQRLRRLDPEIKSKYPPALPSLIHAIYHEDFDRFKVVFKMFKRQFGRRLLEKWPTDEAGKCLSPTPHSASIDADRYDVFFQLFTSGCSFVFPDWLAMEDHPFYRRYKDHFGGTGLILRNR